MRHRAKMFYAPTGLVLLASATGVMSGAEINRFPVGHLMAVLSEPGAVESTRGLGASAPWLVAAAAAVALAGFWAGRRTRRGGQTEVPSAPAAGPGTSGVEPVAAAPAGGADEDAMMRVFQASPAAATISDAKTGVLLEVNAKFCELTRRDRAVMVGRKAVDFNLCDDHAAHRAAIVERLRQGGKVENFETAFKSPDGQPFDVAMSVSLVQYRGRAALLALFFEITERKRAEVALRERELLISSINANLAGTCVYRMVYHPNGQMECDYVSPNVEQMAGVSVAQMKRDARAIFGLIYEEDLPGFRQEIGEALRTGRDAAITVRVRHPERGLRWAQFRSVCAERRPDGCQVRDGVVVDVTADYAMASELLAVRQRLELALRASRTCIWENDLAADRITLDGTWAEMRGYPPQPTVLSWRGLLSTAHPDDRAAIMREVRLAVKGTADDYRMEQRISTAEGGWRWIMSHGRVTERNTLGHAVRMIGTNTDITTRKQAEAEVRAVNANLENLVQQRTAQLAKSERLYRTLVENINLGHFVTNRRSVFTYCNPAVTAVLGRSEAELLGTSVIRLIAPADRQLVVTTYHRWMLEGRQEGSLEFRVVTPDGLLLWVEQSTMIVRDDGGTVVELRNTVRDISERKAAEALLRQSNERFYAVFDRSPIIMGLLTVPEGRLVEFNQAGCRAFGYTRQEALGRTSTELNLWVDGADREHYLRELRSRGHVAEFEAKMRRKNGEIFTVLYSGSLIEIGGQRFSLNSIQDISARREAEAALRASEERLAHALDATRDGLWDWTIATGDVYFSPQYYRLLGYAPGEFGSRVEEFFKLLHPDDVAGIKRITEEHLAGRTPVKQNDIRILTKCGEYRWFLDRGKVVAWDVTGAPARMVGTITDITDRRQAEQEREKIQLRLLQTQKYEALGTLAGGVAHDFNNLLTGIINYTQLARQECPPDYPEVGELLGEALGCSNRAKELVRQILLLSRSEDEQRGPLDVIALVKEVLSLLRSTLPASVEIIADLDPATPAILANSTQLHQVMMNLAINAAHAMREQGGVLSVRVGPRELTAGGVVDLPGVQPGPHVAIEVADTGTGMEAAVLARIFEPFFTTKEVGEGTGLGLALVHSVVRTLGGGIDVRSQEGVGTTFYLYIPAHFAAPVVSAPPAPGPLRGAGQRILLVDDEVVVVTSLQRMLERLGYKVTSSTHPEQAWRLFAAAPEAFDLVFSDFQMPGMNGLEFAKKCLELRPQVPVFIASGFAGKVTPAEMRQQGVTQFFQKPIDMTELAAAIARVVPR